MPVISIPTNQIRNYLYNSNQFSLDSFESLLFNFGLELEETDSPDKVKIEIPANRPDLLAPTALLHYVSKFMCNKPILHPVPTKK